MLVENLCFITLVTMFNFKSAALSFLLVTSFCLATAQVPSYPPAEKVAEDFKTLLQRTTTDFKPEFAEVNKSDSVHVIKGSIFTEANEKMPVLFYKPIKKGQSKFPVVIFLHGTGGTKEGADVRAVLLPLAKRGIMGVAIDARYHGERIPGGAHGSREYAEAAYHAWETNDATDHKYPFLYDTAYDIWRLIDYLTSRPDVDANRIGMGGISMGGIVTYLAAAVDKRIKVAVVGIAAQSFKWSLENNQWQGRVGTVGDAHKRAAKAMGDSVVNATNVKAMWDKILPGITGEFDCPSMIRLLAPRPLLILSKDKDPNNPYPGALIAMSSATNAYKEQQAGNNLNVVVQPNLGHIFNAEDSWLTVEWFSRWLLN